MQITVIPSIHKLHLRPEWNYSLADLVYSVEETRPDVICVEISKDAFEGSYEGLFPPEAAFLAEYFKSKNIPAVATDWRADRDLYTKAPKQIEDKGQKLQSEFQKTLNNQADRVSFLLSPEGKSLTKNIHELYIREHGESSDGFWITRNNRIVDSCLEQALGLGAKRVTLVYGIDHLYILEENLRQKESIELEDSKIYRGQKNLVVSQKVLTRWKENLKKIESALAAEITPRSTRRWIGESKRIPELKLFIEKFSDAGVH